VAEAALLLASDRSCGITGQALMVDSGEMMR
jgi:enoyl-[acyl-carrier-protein] reductase (NADH)